MNRLKVVISFAGGILLSALTLFLALRAVPFGELWGYMGSIDLAWTLPAVVMILASFAIRAIRWQLILRSTHEIDFFTAFHPMMIGFMLNCTFPGRIGEVARPALLMKKEKVSFATGMATVVTERFFDTLFLVVCLIIILAHVEIDPNLRIELGSYQLTRSTLEGIGRRMFQVGALLLAAMVLLSLPRFRRRLNAAIIDLPGRLPLAGPSTRRFLARRMAQPLARVMDHLAAGFALLKSPRQIIACFFLSLAVWGLAAFSYYLFALGCPGIDLVFLEIAAVMVIICFFIALPSVPGFWGVWEAGGVFALTLFGIPAREAAGFTLANHAIQIIPVVLAGLLSALLMGVKVRQIALENDP